MFIEKQELLKKLTIAFDSLANLVAFYIAYIIKKYLLPAEYAGIWVPEELWITLILIPFCYYFWASNFDIYRLRYKRFKTIFLNSLKINVIIILSLLVVFFLFKFHSISRLLILLYFFISLLLIIISRYIIIYIFRYYIKRGFFKKNTLIIGDGYKVEEFISRINTHDIWGVHIMGIIYNNAGEIDKRDRRYKISGTLENLREILMEHPIDEVVCSFPLSKLSRLQYVIEICEELGISIILISNFFNLVLGKSRISNLYGMPLLAFSMTPDFALPIILKRIFDITFSGINLIIFSPALILISLLIKISSPGPVLFIQERCGLNGRVFKMYKFRTMVDNAEQLKSDLSSKNEIDGPVFKMKSDPRITTIGKFLRRTSMDELPQFLNVIKGEMSIVGPRPPLPEEVNKYETWQRRRLSMRPGLTCLWQISGRNNISFDQWMKLDLKYIDNWNLFLDVKILIKTIPAVLIGDGAY